MCMLCNDYVRVNTYDNDVSFSTISNQLINLYPPDELIWAISEFQLTIYHTVSIKYCSIPINRIETCETK